MTLVWSNLRIPRNSIFHLTPQQTQHDLVISNYIIRRLLDKFYSLNDASYCTTSKHPTVNKYWTSFQLYQNKEMGKISKTLLNSLLISTALANNNQDTDDQSPYSVIGCNDESTPVSYPRPMKWTLSRVYTKYTISNGPYNMAHTICSITDGPRNWKISHWR